MESIRRVKVWFDDIKARFDEIGLLREPSILEKRYFVNSDIVVKLRLRRKCGNVKITFIFIIRCLINRFTSTWHRDTDVILLSEPSSHSG